MKANTFIKAIIPALVVMLAVGISVYFGEPKVLEAKATVVETFGENNIVIPKGKEKKPFILLSDAGNIDLSRVEDGIYVGKGQGYAGIIKVQVTIENKKIVSIEILSNGGDDEPYFSKSLEIIDRVISGQNLNVDTVSGATYSSSGILEAIKDAMRRAMGEKTPDVSYRNENTTNENKQDSINWNSYIYKDGEYLGEGVGYNTFGKIKVQVSVLDNKINSIKILSDGGDDQIYWLSAVELIPEIVRTQNPEVDTISGATFSSNGLIEAIKEALKKSLFIVKESEAEDEQANENNAEDEGSNSGGANTENSSAKTYVGQGRGYRYEEVKKGNNPKGYSLEESCIYVEIEVESGEITEVRLKEHKEDSLYIKIAKGILKKIVENQAVEGIDTVSMATKSSNGILEATKDAIDQAIQDGAL